MDQPACPGAPPLAPPPSVHLPDVRDRARAAFLGLAIGDALGATVEFMTAGEIRAAHGVHRELSGGGWLRLRPGQVTDDTEMSLAMARAVDAAGGWSAPAVAAAFAAWLTGRPTDVGSTCRAGIRRFMLDGTTEGQPGEWDAGNGAAMRVLPVALLTLGDDAALRRVAVAQARITHHHPLSDAACVLVARLVQQACLGRQRAADHCDGGPHADEDQAESGHEGERADHRRRPADPLGAASDQLPHEGGHDRQEARRGERRQAGQQSKRKGDLHGQRPGDGDADALRNRSR